MKKLSPQNLSQEVFDLYDQFAHNQINRREFVEKLSVFAVGGLTISSLLEYLLPNYVDKVQVQQDDPRIETKYITYDSPKGGGEIKGLLATPAGLEEKLPGVIIVHENRGLNPHIEDVCRRAGLANFIALAPDALSPLGGYPGNDDDGRALQRKRDKAEMLEDFIAAFEYLKSHPNCTGQIGVVGFCFGGYISHMMAVRVPELKAAVPFYGSQPEAEDAEKINAPLLIHFGELDERVNAGWPVYEASLKAHGKTYEAHFYPDANHGFHNDTTPRYDKEAAELAWSRTIDFFNTHLR